MRISLRMLALGGLLTALAACGQGTEAANSDDSSKDYRAMKPEEVCELLTTDEAAEVMKPVTSDKLSGDGEQQNSMPACRYGSGDGGAYLLLSIHQSSSIGDDEKAEKVTVAGQKALQLRPNTGCSVALPLDERLYLLAVVESWKSQDEESCAAASGALEQAYPRLPA